MSRERRSAPARAGLAMAVATLTMALGSGAQAVLYLSQFGVTERTDAFFAAFALYSAFGIFTQSIRVTSVPLLVGPKRMRAREFAATLGVIAVPVILVCGPLAGLAGEALAPGVDEDARNITVDGLRILGGAMVLHLVAAGAATVLGVWERFDIVARAYIAGALAGLVTYVVVQPAVDELALGWAALAGGAVTATWMAAGLARVRSRTNPPGEMSPRSLAGGAGRILRRTLVYFVINGLFLITFAVTSSKSAGNATVLSYVYIYATYLVAVTSVAVGIARLPDMARGASDDWNELFEDTVPHGFRYAVLVCAPGLAGLVAAGAGLAGELFPDSLPAADVDTLRTFGALLAPWLVAALVLNFVLPALFALGRSGLVNLLALPLVLLHAAATVAGGKLFGAEGAVGAFFIAPLTFGAVLLWIAGGARRASVAREMTWDAVRFAGLAAAAFGAAAAAATLVPQGAVRSLAAAVLGTGLYLAGVRLLAPRQLGVLLGSGGPSARPRDAEGLP